MVGSREIFVLENVEVEDFILPNMTDFCVLFWEISFFTTPFPPCNEVDEGIGATWLKVHFKISSPREAEFEKKIKNLGPNVLLMHGWKWKKEYERMKYDDIL